MPARRFLWVIVILVILVIAAGVVYRLFAVDLFRIALVPSVSYGESRLAPAPDYALPASWQARPGLAQDVSRWAPQGYAAAPKPGVAVFWVTPTAYLDRSGWNAPLNDATTNERLDLFLKAQATVFNGVAAVWAPRYRQATFGSFLTDKPAAKQAIDLAYSDVLRAFDVFLAAVPADAPIILAGHSQGSLHLLRLMQARVAGTPLAKRIVAVYIVGWPVSVEADLPALGLPACAAPEATGCVLSWQSFAEPAETKFLHDAFDAGTGLIGAARRGTHILCTNPLLGAATRDIAKPERNLGALPPAVAKAGGAPVARSIGAFCDADGYLNVGDPPAGFDLFVLPGNNYHVYDYGLFWASVRADVETRVNAFQAPGLATVPESAE